MENIEALTLGEIVKQNYKAAAVLEKYSLDYCCRGNQNFNDACKAGNIQPSAVIDELNRIQNDPHDGVDFDTWPLDLLVDYICRRHHTYVEERTPLLKAHLDKISQVHGSHHPEIREVRDIFYEIGSELAVHMKKEELMLFPFIKKLEYSKNAKTQVTSPVFGSVSIPVDMMKDEHALEGDKFQRIVALTNSYQVPADSCNTVEVTYQLLKEFEKDLHLHIHLENNILFPKAVALEKEIADSK